MLDERDVRGHRLLQKCCALIGAGPLRANFATSFDGSSSSRLAADPAKRITIHEIQDHPWYMKDLPPGVKEMNDNMRMPPAGSQVCRVQLRLWLGCLPAHQKVGLGTPCLGIG